MENNTTPTVPAVWPGVFEIYKLSRARVRRNLGPLVTLLLLPVGINIVVSIILGLLFGKNTADILGEFTSLFIGTYFAVLAVRAYLLTARQKHFTIETIMRMPASLFWRMMGLSLLTFFTVLVGMILLVVPGIIFAMRLSAAYYFLVDKDMGVMEAYKASWHATKGHLGKLWGYVGFGLLILLPAVTIIGILATIYFAFMFTASGAIFYLFVLKHQKTEA